MLTIVTIGGIMILKRSAVWLTAIVLTVGTGTAPGLAAKSYKDCASLRLVYKNGVAESGFRNKGAQIQTPAINTVVYRANRKLDSDKDKVACEVSKKTSSNSGQSSGTSAPTQSGPAMPISLDNLDPIWTPRLALKSVQELQKRNPPLVGLPQIIASPTTRKSEVDLERRLLDEAVTTFQKYFLPEKLQVVMFTNLDSTWADEALINYGGFFPGRVSEEIVRQSEGPRRCSFGFATQNFTTRVPIYYGCTDTRSERDIYNYQNPAHEYFHLVHNHLAPVRVPLWLFEGSASYFGEALGYDEFANYEAMKKQQGFITGFYFDPDGKGLDPNRFKTWLQTLSPEEAVRIFTILEGEPENRSAYAHYSLGSWATEALVATYGVEKYMELWVGLGSNKSFNAAFLETFGVTPVSFYQKLTPYLRSRAAG